MRQITTVLGEFLVWEGDHLGQVLESGAFWDAQLKPFLDEGDPTGWAIDVGANIGFLSRYLRSKYVGVIAVEAHPVTAGVLQANMQGSDVEVIWGVAYDRAPAWFTVAPDALLGWPAGNLDSCPNVASLAYVRCFEPTALESVVLDSVVGTRPISLIKVDAQGCDLRALRGLRQTIRRDRPLILFEFEEAASSWQGDDWDDYLRFFSAEGYNVTRIREDIWDYVARPL
jgi:FkbM family methyltransferase